MPQDNLLIPRPKVLKETKVGSKIISIKRKYVSDLNQVCNLDSNYEYDYALYLDWLYNQHKITGWLRNITPFYFSREIDTHTKAGTQSYCIPDFLIFNLDGTYQIHEVKGWMNERSKAVHEQFLRDYPNLNYKVIGKDEILSLQVEFADKLWGWVKIR